MRTIIEVLRLKYDAGLSHEKIARACGLSKGVVSKYVSLAQVAGITWPLPEDTDEAALEARLFPAKTPPVRFAAPDYFQVHQELKRKGVTLQLLWAEHVAAHGDKAYHYSQFCHHYRTWRDRQRRSMRQVHRAGEKLFIDYCGPTVSVSVVNQATGEVRNAQVFVAVLGASSYTFAEATWRQSLPDWIASHQRAFQFFGGVPELVVPDNLKSAVTRACRYESQLNTTYAEMARHYQVAVLPARPYKPKDKAKERGKHLVKIDQWFASSKTCHVCQHKTDAMPLNVRSWDCPAYHTHHDRDINAALNIKHQGILTLKAEGLSVSAHRGSRNSGRSSVAA